MRSRLSSFAPAAVLLGFFASIALIFVAACSLIVWVWFSVAASIATQLSIGLLLALLFLCWALWTVARMPRGELDGVPITHDDAPALFEMVEQATAATESPSLNEVRLTTAVSLAWAERSGFLGLRRGRRNLSIGYPLVIGLTAEQLRALIVHECAHYSGKPALRGLAFRGRAAIEQTLTTTALFGLVGVVLRGFARFYAWVARPAIAAQRQHADETAIKLAGKDVLAAALRRVAALEIGWEIFLDQYLRWGWETGYRPRGCLIGFEHLITVREQALSELAKNLPEGISQDNSGVKTSVDARIRAIESAGAAPARDGTADDRQARELFAKLAERVDALEAQFMSDANRDPLPWPEFLVRGAVIGSQEAASELYSAAGKVAKDPEPTMRTVIELLRAGRANDLVGEVAQLDTGSAEYVDYAVAADEAAEALANAAASAVVTAGVGWWRVSWEDDNLVSVVGPDGEPQPWQDLAESAILGEVEPFQERLEALGIDTSVRQTSVGAGIGQNWVCGLSDVRADGFSYDLLLHTGGFILAPVGGIAAPALAADGVRRVSSWFDMLPSDAAKTPGATHVPHQDILSARLLHRSPWSGEFVLLDGRKLVVAALRRSAFVGEDAQALVNLVAVHQVDQPPSK